MLARQPAAALTAMVRVDRDQTGRVRRADLAGWCRLPGPVAVRQGAWNREIRAHRWRCVPRPVDER